MKVRLAKTTPLDGARCLHRDGRGIIEARILPHDGSVPLAGFFESPKRLASALAELNGELSHASVYATLNPVDPSLLSRAKNRFRTARRGQQATDKDILSLRWLPIDVDAVRPRNTAATDDELRAAQETRDAIVRYLRGRGFPACIKALSGNGAHALFALDLPNTPENVTILKRVLKALDERFSTTRVKVDTSVANASRVWKLYGTFSRKGAASKKRPHRRAWIEKHPTPLVAVSSKQLQAISKSAAGAVSESRPRTLVDAFKAKGLYLRPLGDGRHAVRCLWADEHSVDSTDTETVVFEPSRENRLRGGYKCQHDHCAERTVADVLKVLPISAAEVHCLADIEPETVHWLWRPYIALGKLTLIEGDPGIGKSWLSLALASAITKGKGLPEMARREPANVLLLTAEDGLGDTIRPRLDAIGGNLERIFSLGGPIVFNDKGLGELDETIARTGAVLVVVDPLVAYLGAGVDLHRANETRAVMSRLSDIAAKHSCAIVLIRHLTKSGKDKSIYRGLGSIDLTAACRSVLLVGRDPEDTNRAALVHIKSNLARAGESQGYTVDNGRFVWTGPTALTASDLLAAETTTRTGTDDAEALLREALKDGEKQLSELKKAAADAGITPKMLRRARLRLGVESVWVRDKKGKAVGAQWRLPKPAKEKRANGHMGK